MDSIRCIGAGFKSHRKAAKSVALTMLLAWLMTGCTTLTGSGVDYGSESEAYGVWTGQFPCAGCPGVDARLVLWRDPNLFRLTEVFKRTGAPPRTFSSSGVWRVENIGKAPELGRLSLTTDDGRRTLYLERLPRGGLRLLDPNGETAADESAVLQRTRARPEQD